MSVDQKFENFSRSQIALLLHLASEMGAHISVEAAKNLLAAIDKNSFNTQAGEDASKLHRDIATADDDDPATGLELRHGARVEARVRWEQVGRVTLSEQWGSRRRPGRPGLSARGSRR